MSTAKRAGMIGFIRCLIGTVKGKMDNRIKRILIGCGVVGALLSVGSLFVLDGRHFGGVFSGAVIGTLNFYFWVLIVRRMVGDESGRTGLFVRFLLKYGLTALLIGVAIFLFNVSVLGFAVGVSNFIIAILLGGAHRQADEEEST